MNMKNLAAWSKRRDREEEVCSMRIGEESLLLIFCGKCVVLCT